MPLPDNLFGSSVDFNGSGPLEGFSMPEGSIVKDLYDVYQHITFKIVR